MKKEVEIEVSARHIHLSKSDYHLLFGPETSYENQSELSQKNQFVTDKTVKVAGREGELEAKFLSPFRDRTQVELSKSDCFQLGIAAPYKISVDDEATEIKLSGSEGEISRRAAIIAKRHLHASLSEATELGIQDGDSVSVLANMPRGKILFHDVVVKTGKDFVLRVHLDTDEGNAAGIDGKCLGELIIPPKNDELSK